ncbi:unannotated protein [freshwater metagenome]|uniref:Unannotated protein n=1 Tax=freshwater metagenome TaxID=449393 RepID=A0A6J7UG26_9ZZZZ
MNAVFPTVEAMTMLRPDSIALARVICNCWSLSADSPNVALFVCAIIKFELLISC